jgi:hypothetical protein
MRTGATGGGTGTAAAQHPRAGAGGGSVLTCVQNRRR